MIKTVIDFIDKVEGLYHEWKPDEDGIWFRGVKDSTYVLKPSFFRQNKEPEYHFAVDFMSQAAPLLSDGERPKGDQIACEWQWYFLMQHYGTPTRLLDWTELPLGALYFALRELTNPAQRNGVGGNPCVWALDPQQLNKFSVQDSEVICPGGKWSKNWLFRKSADAVYGVERGKPLQFSYRTKDYCNDRPIAIYPVRANARILAQRGVFSVHGADDRGLEEIYDPRQFDHRLQQLDICPDAVDTMLTQLRHLGVSEFSLFPELSSLSSHIKKTHGLT